METALGAVPICAPVFIVTYLLNISQDCFRSACCCSLMDSQSRYRTEVSMVGLWYQRKQHQAFLMVSTKVGIFTSTLSVCSSR